MDPNQPLLNCPRSEARLKVLATSLSFSFYSIQAPEPLGFSCWLSGPVNSDAAKKKKNKRSINAKPQATANYAPTPTPLCISLTPLQSLQDPNSENCFITAAAAAASI